MPVITRRSTYPEYNYNTARARAGWHGVPTTRRRPGGPCEARLIDGVHAGLRPNPPQYGRLGHLPPAPTAVGASGPPSPAVEE